MTWSTVGGGRILRPALAAAMVLVAACTQSEPDWNAVELPGGGEVVAMAAAPSGLVVGRYDPGAPVRSSVTLVDASTGGMTEVPLVQGEGYAAEARLVSLSTHDDHVIALGGAHGGAHGNVRWTVWAGTTTGVREQPQPFETFGGWGAGTLVGSAYSTAGPIIIGSWSAESGVGFDVAVWRQDGNRWVRVPTPGSALLADATRQPSVTAVAASPELVVAVGAVTVLGDRPRVVPASWIAESPGGPWREVPLPLPGVDDDIGQAVAVSCSASHCVIGGRADSDIVAWRLDLDSAMAVSPVGVAGGVPDDTTVVAAAAANGDWIALTDGTNTRVARVRRDGWDSVRITGRLGAMATDSTGRAVLATTAPDGITRLWTSRR